MLLETVLKCTAVGDTSIADNPEVQDSKGQNAISIYSLPLTNNPFQLKSRPPNDSLPSF